jgi:hypothetical protein
MRRAQQRSGVPRKRDGCFTPNAARAARHNGDLAVQATKRRRAGAEVAHELSGLHTVSQQLLSQRASGEKQQTAPTSMGISV